MIVGVFLVFVRSLGGPLGIGDPGGSLGVLGAPWGLPREQPGQGWHGGGAPGLEHFCPFLYRQHGTSTFNGGAGRRACIYNYARTALTPDDVVCTPEGV